MVSLTHKNDNTVYLKRGEAKRLYYIHNNDINNLIISGFSTKEIYNQIFAKNNINLPYDTFYRLFSNKRNHLVINNTTLNNVNPASPVDKPSNQPDQPPGPVTRAFEPDRRAPEAAAGLRRLDEVNSANIVGLNNQKDQILDEIFRDIELQYNQFDQTGGFTELELNNIRAKLFGGKK